MCGRQDSQKLAEFSVGKSQRRPFLSPGRPIESEVCIEELHIHNGYICPLVGTKGCGAMYVSALPAVTPQV